MFVSHQIADIDWSFRITLKLLDGSIDTHCWPTGSGLFETQHLSFGIQFMCNTGKKNSF